MQVEREHGAPPRALPAPSDSEDDEESDSDDDEEEYDMLHDLDEAYKVLKLKQESQGYHNTTSIDFVVDGVNESEKDIKKR